MNYKGSCHCGNVAFEVEGEITGAVACNCSICSRTGDRPSGRRQAMAMRGRLARFFNYCQPPCPTGEEETLAGG